MRVVIGGTQLPGASCGQWRNVHVALQVGREPVGLVSADAESAQWATEISVTTTGDFRGSAVQGKRGERFLYLTWGEVAGDTFAMFRRAKLMLTDLPPGLSEDAVVTATVSLTDGLGHPRCARVKPPAISWSIS